MNQSQKYKLVVLALCAAIAIAGGVVSYLVPTGDIGEYLATSGCVFFIIAFLFIDIVPDPKAREKIRDVE